MKTTCPPAENVYLMKPPSLLSVVTLLWGLFSGFSGSPHPHLHKKHFYIEIWSGNSEWGASPHHGKFLLIFLLFNIYLFILWMVLSTINQWGCIPPNQGVAVRQGSYKALETCLPRNGSLAKYATTAFNLNWNNEKLAVVVHIP